MLQRHRHTLIALLLVVASAGVTAVRYQLASGHPIEIILADAGEQSVALSGFAAREPWGRWSDGPRAQVSFRRSLPRAFRLSLDLQGFGPNIGKTLIIHAGAVTRDVQVPASMAPVVVDFTGVPPLTQTITFDIPAPTSPRALGVSADLRRLGVGIDRLTMQELDHAD